MARLSTLMKPPLGPDGQPKQWLHSQPLSTLQGMTRPPEWDGYQDSKNLPTDTADPYLNPVLRCPLPAINASNSDALRQWYRKGATQFRILLPVK